MNKQTLRFGAWSALILAVGLAWGCKGDAANRRNNADPLAACPQQDLHAVSRARDTLVQLTGGGHKNKAVAVRDGKLTPLGDDPCALVQAWAQTGTQIYVDYEYSNRRYVDAKASVKLPAGVHIQVTLEGKLTPRDGYLQQPAGTLYGLAQEPFKPISFNETVAASLQNSLPAAMAGVQLDLVSAGPPQGCMEVDHITTALHAGMNEALEQAGILTGDHNNTFVRKVARLDDQGKTLWVSDCLDFYASTP